MGCYGNDDEETSTKKPRMMSSALFDVVSKHLNVRQIYIHKRAFLVENRYQEIENTIKSLEQIQRQTREVINEHINESVKDFYKDAIDYMDTKRDKDTLKAVIAMITSVKFASRLQDVTNKQSVRWCRDVVPTMVDKFKTIKKTIVVPDQEKLSKSQLRVKRNRLIKKSWRS